MSAEDMLRTAMERRAQAGLMLRITGGEIDPAVYPRGFAAYAKDEAQRDRWAAQWRAKGSTVEFA